MKKNVNFEIALTHLLTRKKQTVVASLGVTVGITAFVFLNSLVVGFTRYFDQNIFKSLPHLRVYKNETMSAPLMSPRAENHAPVIVNPKILNEAPQIVNPGSVLSGIRSVKGVTHAVEWITVNLFYISGRSQVNGVAMGARMSEADAMLQISSSMVAGSIRDLESSPNGILIGDGIAKKLNLRLNDNLTVISSRGVTRVMKVAGIFKTSFSFTDNSKSYVNLAAAQQLLREGPAYVTEVYVNVENPQQAELYNGPIERMSGYDVENWKQANETYVAGSKTRNIMMRSISAAILLVAAFGIYNILNMTIMQKLNDIAILKATGFSGRDVVKIFVGEAFVMGLAGTITGLFVASILVHLLSKVHIGGDIGYFPIGFEPSVVVLGAVVGIIVTLGAGFFPARNAARVDPIEIFRR